MKFISLTLLLFTMTGSNLFADNINIVSFQIFKKNDRGGYTPQTAPKHQLILGIRNSNTQGVTSDRGMVQLKLKEKYPTGKPITLVVKGAGADWKITQPKNGVVIVPSPDRIQPIHVILEQILKQPSQPTQPATNRENRPAPTPQPTTPANRASYFTVQVFVTRDPNKAREFVYSLKKQGFNAYPESLYRTRDGNGFEEKIFVGKFRLRDEAEQMLGKIKQRAGIKKPFVQEIFL